MSQRQVLLHNKLDKHNKNLIQKIKTHCIFDVLTDQFKCREQNCVVYVDWSRNYAFCSQHGML